MKVIFVYNIDELSSKEIEFLRKIIPVEVRKEVSDTIVNAGMVDIFDFVTYQKEYKFMGQYFTELERTLRTALLVDYKYNHLSEEGRTELTRALEKKKSAKEKAEYLKLILDTFEPLYIIHHFYRHYAPKKTAKEIDAIYKKYEHQPGVMFNCAYRVYVDKELPKATQSEKLWFEK